MYVNILVELIAGYVALYIVVSFLGKTQISQITPFDFISALVLGELVGSAVFDQKVDFLMILFTVGVWGMLIYLTELTTQKFRRLRYLLEGKPSIIINQGKLDWNELKKNRLDIDQLLQLLRFKDIFSLQDVEYAFLESNGGISVLKKAGADQPTCRDLKIKGEKRRLPLTIISDGEVLYENLKKAGLDENWLYKELEAQGGKLPREISYAEYQRGQSLFIQTY